MFMYMNAMDRELSEWPGLFAQADPRFDYKGSTGRADIPASREKSGPVLESGLRVMEAVWTP